MNTNELISIWKEYDQQLESRTSVNTQLLKEVSIQKVKSHFKEFTFENVFELVLSSLFAIILISFIINNAMVARYALPAIYLLIMMITAMVFTIWKLKQLYSISYSTPVLAAQRKIEKIVYYDRLDTNLLYINIPIFAAAFMIVFCKAVLHLDLYQVLGVYMWHFILVSFVIAIIIVWFIRRFPDKKIEKAIQFLTDIKEFEN